MTKRRVHSSDCFVSLLFFNLLDNHNDNKITRQIEIFPLDCFFCVPSHSPFVLFPPSTCVVFFSVSGWDYE
jgi:hypothetical protein